MATSTNLVAKQGQDVSVRLMGSIRTAGKRLKTSSGKLSPSRASVGPAQEAAASFAVNSQKLKRKWPLVRFYFQAWGVLRRHPWGCPHPQEAGTTFR